MVTGVDCEEKAGKDYVAHKQLWHQDFSVTYETSGDEKDKYVRATPGMVVISWIFLVFRQKHYLC